MLLTKDLIKNVEEQYIDMLRAVNIPDFYKCLAEFSGLEITQIDDNTVLEYLLTWAHNKHRFYKMLGNKLKKDVPFTYKKFRETIKDEMSDLGKEYPAYALWLDCFKKLKSNKIDVYDVDWSARDKIHDVFPHYRISGVLLTHFFKRMLNAPDDLVTKIAHIFENDTVEATHTISIDPVDMMLASENPYKWDSCYRLETENESSHADGCLASVLDNTTLITYIWNNEGKLNIYDKYDFKKVRYKRMRQWIAISKNLTTIHFNTIYPGKNYDKDFEKSVRILVEKTVANYLGIEDMWKCADDAGVDTYRVHRYGYNEFRNFYMYYQSASEPENIKVYDEQIYCPCGCRTVIDGSDEGKEYRGEGFTCNGYEDEWYCEYLDDYCSCECCVENCLDCEEWKRNHPVCSLDPDRECESPDWDATEDGLVTANSESCEHCAYWEECHKEELEENSESEDEEPKVITIQDSPIQFSSRLIASNLPNPCLTTTVTPVRLTDYSVFRTLNANSNSAETFSCPTSL